MFLTKSLKRNNEHSPCVSAWNFSRSKERIVYKSHAWSCDGLVFSSRPLYYRLNSNALMHKSMRINANRINVWISLNFTPYFQTEWPLQTLPWLLGKLMGKGYGDIACSACLTRMGSHWVISPNSVVSQKMTGRFSSYIQNSFMQKTASPLQLPWRIMRWAQYTIPSKAQKICPYLL